MYIKQRVLCQDSLTDKTIVDMAGSSLSQPTPWQLCELCFLMTHTLQEKDLLCLLSVNRAIINWSIDCVIDDSVGFKRFGWIKNLIYLKNRHHISQITKRRKITGWWFYLQDFRIFHDQYFTSTEYVKSNNHGGIRNGVFLRFFQPMWMRCIKNTLDAVPSGLLTDGSEFLNYFCWESRTWEKSPKSLWGRGV